MNIRLTRLQSISAQKKSYWLCQMGLKVQSSFMDWCCIPAGKVGHNLDTLTSSFGTWAGQSLARASCCHCNVWLRHVQCLCCLHGGCNLDQEHAMTSWVGMSCSRMWSNLEGECQVSKAICLDSAVKYDVSCMLIRLNYSVPIIVSTHDKVNKTDWIQRHCVCVYVFSMLVYMYFATEYVS